MQAGYEKEMQDEKKERLSAVETALLGVGVMAVHAEGLEEGKHVLRVGGQVRLRLGKGGAYRQEDEGHEAQAARRPIAEPMQCPDGHGNEL